MFFGEQGVVAVVTRDERHCNTALPEQLYRQQGNTLRSAVGYREIVQHDDASRIYVFHFRPRVWNTMLHAPV